MITRMCHSNFATMASNDNGNNNTSIKNVINNNNDNNINNYGTNCTFYDIYFDVF